MCTESLQACLTLCDSMDCSPPGPSVLGILQARILEWVGMPSFRDLPNPGIDPMSLMSPALAGGFFSLPLAPPGKPNFGIGFILPTDLCFYFCINHIVLNYYRLSIFFNVSPFLNFL